ncbi:MAG: hypothetical protein V2B18_08860 [Pseudomonadota bacterium]
MDVKCAKCATRMSVPDQKVPVGRSYIVCPKCDSRINIFKGLPVGTIVRNILGVRFFKDAGDFHDEFCEPGELWRIEEIIQPCPDREKGKSCEAENKGRCPNQKLVLRRLRDGTVHTSCLYRKGRRVFDKSDRAPVGDYAPWLSPPQDDDKTYRIR